MFLVSDSSNYIMDSNLRVVGGFSIAQFGPAVSERYSRPELG